MAGVHLYNDNWTEAVALLERALDDAKDSPALLVQNPDRRWHSANDDLEVR